jgi:superfamily II DNA helicase RecQ
LARIESTIADASTADGDGAGTDRGRARLAAAREQVAQAQRRSGVKPDGARGSELLKALMAWRRNLARASAVPAYVIFPNTTLEAVAERRPTSRNDLLAIPGIGPVKLERHGEALLDLVGQHPS